jgi:hypothetical protein
MTYNERVQDLLGKIQELVSQLNNTFYFTEAEYLHQQDGGKWSAIEELEYANLYGYLLFDAIQTQPKVSGDPKPNKTHRLGWYCRLALKKTHHRPEKLDPHLTPVSRRTTHNERVRINEQKVFSDMLALLESWKKMLESGENLRKLQIRTGWANLLRLDALEVVSLSLSVIETQVKKAQECSRQSPV